jgi:hypothetical protein
MTSGTVASASWRPPGGEQVPQAVAAHGVPRVVRGELLAGHELGLRDDADRAHILTLAEPSIVVVSRDIGTDRWTDENRALDRAIRMEPVHLICGRLQNPGHVAFTRLVAH